MNEIKTWRAGRGVLVVGAVGLALGVTGGAQAAGLITGKQIKNGTVTSADVRDSTITGLDVRQLSLTPDDYAGEVRGPQGSRGDQGVAGRPGVRLVGFAASQATEVPAKKVGVAEAQCDPGVNAIAGGLTVVGDDLLTVLDSAPAGNPSPQNGPGWVVRVQNPTSTPASYIVWAICAEVR